MEQQFLEVNRANPVTYFPIGGTHSWDEDDNHYQWWERGSEFTRQMATLGLVLHARNPFVWATNIDGTLFQRKHTIWKAAAKHLICHLGDDRIPYAQRNVVAHSHGGQVVFFACADGLKIQNLITVGTPVRKDMEKVVLQAIGNIGYWHHICDSSSDRMAILGTLFDGAIRIKHNFEVADSSSDVKGVGHSKILNDPKFIPLWKERGWASILAYGKKAFL